ncbi:NPC1-like intracellular cholesterol transporter 1 [Tachyglossus aculeatus]|uniref:NPC1-like intracellular cholesterol transporter 1 n=1 Tax=Tachyglossus aculeatus TaxID=9261 RepID=UPI0018F3CD45|nr:NPC1-like intracellular cholesterol transporter 1 [Tachyglossus aculeatus]
MVGAGLGALLLLASLFHGAQATFTPIHRAGFCSVYEECGRNPEISGSLIPPIVPCLDNSPARALDGEHLQLLQEVCPHLDRGPRATFACCSLKQLRSLKASVALSKVILTRCPACAENFASLHCQNICSPDQSLFINVTRVHTDGSSVLAYQSFCTRRYAEEAYSSCSDVRIPATGGLAVGAMCGVYGAELCNAQRWLNFQGNPSNGLAPLQVDFHLLDPGQEPGAGLQPLDVDLWQCHLSYGDTMEACSCQDCAAACPVLPNPAPLNPGISRVTLGIVLALVLLLVAVLICGAATAAFCYRRTEAKPVSQAGVSCSDRLSLSTHATLGRLFQRWGTWAATWPLTVLGLAAVAVVALAGGLARLELTTDPVELWSAPDSQARQEKAFHDLHFGPFFRTNQVILTAPGRASYHYDSLLLGPKNFSGLLASDVLLQLLDLQERLRDLQVWSEPDGRNISLRDFCYAPLNPRNASLTDCAINSLLQYFQSNRTSFLLTANQTLSGQTGQVDWRDHFLYCANSPLSFKDGTALELSCMADYGAPVFPFLAVGGYKGRDFSEAEALILTFSLNNYPAEDPRLAHVRLWESRFLEVLRDFRQSTRGQLSVTFMAERSLEDEINRTTAEDLPIFAISYAVIFLYITLALGEYSSWRRLLVDSKAMLGLGGVLVVLGAVLASMGFYSYLGIPSSLVIIQVVPFLVLAVGADNIFILVLEFQRIPRRPSERREEHIGRVLGSVAPSMLLCSLSEIICFFLGALTRMPAVRTFALTAGLAVIFDFLLQMTAFVALLSLDARRQEASRLDVCCCVQMADAPARLRGEGLLLRFFRRFYVPFLLHRVTRVVVMVLFVLLFGMGLFFMVFINVGLDQELALPQDSYLLDYFLYLNRYFEVGVPTYFVTTSGFNFSSTEALDAICSSAGCQNNSLTQKIQYATQFSNLSYLAIPASSWVDDFIDWLNPLSECCRIHSFGPNKDEFCPSTINSLSCTLNKCMRPTSGVLRPTPEQFNKYLPWFLNDYPNLKCPKGGLGAYDSSVKIGPEGEILASRFMAYHTPLKNSQEYTGALRAARELAASITATLRQVPGTDPNFKVFPYTITYVFYEQYLTIVVEGLFMVALCLTPTFLVCCFLLGMDLRSGLLNLVSIVMIVVDTVGFMTLWGISYNAVSLINLVTAVGISVEFVSHITRSFAISTRPTRLERATEATVIMGSEVFAGVAMTNLPGIIVLAFANAQLIQIFFFRLNLLITILGTLHGLVFLPVALSYLGPGVNQALLQQEKKQEQEEAGGATPWPGDLCSSSFSNTGFEGDVKLAGDPAGSAGPPGTKPRAEPVGMEPRTESTRYRSGTEPWMEPARTEPLGKESEDKKQATCF